MLKNHISMKKLLLLLLFLNVSVVFSQTDKDISEIIQLVINEYKSDTISVYFRFKNDRLKSDLEITKSIHDRKIYEVHNGDFDYYVENIAPRVDDDSVTVRMEKIKLTYSIQQKITKKTNNKRVRRFVKSDFKKSKRNTPFAFISIPLVSTDTKKAIVYGSYYCGGLWGSGGVFFFEKINKVWTFINYEQRWVS